MRGLARELPWCRFQHGLAMHSSAQELMLVDRGFGFDWAAWIGQFGLGSCQAWMMFMCEERLPYTVCGLGGSFGKMASGSAFQLCQGTKWYNLPSLGSLGSLHQHPAITNWAHQRFICRQVGGITGSTRRKILDSEEPVC